MSYGKNEDNFVKSSFAIFITYINNELPSGGRDIFNLAEVAHVLEVGRLDDVTSILNKESWPFSPNNWRSIWLAREFKKENETMKTESDFWKN